MKHTWIIIPALFFSMSSAMAQQPDPTQLITQMQEAMGGWDKLYALKDVEFTYDYYSPQQGVRDLSTERYIFEGEHSWAKYSTHQINVLPDQPGEAIQSLVNNQATISHQGKLLTDPQVLGGAEFLRRANYFWFVMFFKLKDPGTIHEYLGEEQVKETTYHKVRVTYNSGKTGKAQNDGYVLYIHPETHLVDQFYFSLPAMGMNDIAIKMKVEYETLQGVKLPLKRTIYMPGPDGKVSSEPSLIQTSTDITFSNGFTPEDFKLMD